MFTLQDPNATNQLSKFAVALGTNTGMHVQEEVREVCLGWNDYGVHYFEVTIDQLDPSKSLVGVGMARGATKTDQPLWDAFGSNTSRFCNK